MNFIDKTTFEELSILNISSDHRGLDDIFDNTKTIHGKDKLNKILSNPLNDLEMIYSFQQQLNLIIKNIDDWLPYAKLLSSRSYKEIASKRNNQMINFKPYFKFSIRTIFFKRQDNIVVDFLKELTTITRKIFNESDKVEVIRKLTSSISHFSTVTDKSKYTTKYINWFCFDNKYKYMCSMLDELHEIDALVSIALNHIKYNLKFPEWTKDEWEFDSLYTLFTDNPVSYSFTIPKDKNKILITGPNMAGKSTFMTSFGQAVYLAHCGFGVPSKKAKLRWISNINTAFNSKTMIDENLSYFGNEVERSIKLLYRSKEENYNLLLIDELYKGTNNIDSNECLNFYINKLYGHNSLTILSTHMTEVVDKFSNDSSCEQFYFSGKEINEKIIFDYRLKKGISNQCFGLKILKEKYNNFFIDKINTCKM